MRRPAVRTVLALAVLLSIVAAACTTKPASDWTFGPTIAPEASASAAAPPAASAAAGSAAPVAPGAPSPQPSAAASPQPSAAAASWRFVSSTSCPGTTFECITLAVPKDHFAATAGPTWNVTFGIHRATKARKGTYVEITGGPGYSDIPASDDYLDYYDSGIVDSFDIVYLDQRGAGLSGGIQCTKAAATFYASSAKVHVPAERAAAVAAAQAFAKDCVAEARVAEADLPYYATRQAVEDLEAVRQYLGTEKLDLYGLSYGTQFVQTYAAAHPEHIATLYVDGPVDLTLDGPAFYVEAARSADDTLVATLDACTADESCKAGVLGGDALAAYDALAASLATAPATIDFPKGDGTTAARTFSAADLENVAFSGIYYTVDRMLLQRAVGAASHGDLVPLARLGYSAIGIDPDTLEAIPYPDYSDALYYAVECQDYAFFPDIADAAARVDAWVKRAEESGVNATRMATGFYGDLPCLFWPTAATTNVRPAPIVDPPYPTFVLASTTDPATPIANGMRIYSRLSDAWFIQAVGGPHVIYAWGEACPDELMTAWLTERTPPAARVTTCPWTIADAYVANAATRASGYATALDLATSVDDQIFNTNDYLNIYDGETLTLGCDFGGTLSYKPSDLGTTVTLTACAFTPDLPLTGTGEADDEAGSFELDVKSGVTTLHYERDGEGATSVTGRFRGKAVNQQAPA